MRIDDDDWQKIERSIPIPCVDVLPWKLVDGVPHCGLILREDDAGGLRWNLVGGRIWLDENIGQAIGRHVRETLGPEVEWDQADFSRPVMEQYLRTPQEGYGFDPRHHAVAFSYGLRISGDITVGGEAKEFRFFAPGEFPTTSEIGFQQGNVIYTLKEAVESEHPR